MKRLLIILLLAPIAGMAQNTLLFEVAKKGIAQKSYLFGTLHVQDERAFAFNDSVMWAIDQSKTAAFELNLDQTELASSLTKEKMKGLIDTAFITRLTAYISNDFLPTLMERMTPEELSTKIVNDLLPNYFDLLKNKLSSNQRASFVDLYLQEYARSKKKEIVGIETYTEQIMALLGDINAYAFDDKQLSTKIVDYLQNSELNLNIAEWMSGTEEMILAYGNADLSQLCQTVVASDDGKALSSAFYKRIFTDRNDLMYERMKGEFKKGGLFMAVGAGHLCSDNGLISQLKREGYSLRPINVTTAYTRSYQWESTQHKEYKVDLPEGITLAQNSGIYASLSLAGEAGIHLFTQKGIASFNIEFKYATELDEEFTYDGAMAAEEVYNDYPYDTLNTGEMAAESVIIDGYSGYEIEPNIDSTLAEIEYTEGIDYEDDLIAGEITVTEGVEEPSEEAIEVVYDETEAEYIPTKSPKKKMQEILTPAQTSYMEEVVESIGKQYKEEMGGRMSGMMNMYQVTKDTMYFGLQKELCIYQSGMMVGNTLSYEVPHGEGFYLLTITGDPALLKSEDLHRFFTSFKIL
jgi:uncharacterized protein